MRWCRLWVWLGIWDAPGSAVSSVMGCALPLGVLGAGWMMWAKGLGWGGCAGCQLLGRDVVVAFLGWWARFRSFLCRCAHRGLLGCN